MFVVDMLLNVSSMESLQLISKSVRGDVNTEDFQEKKYDL